MITKTGGFTFVEVVIATAIFLLFAIGAYQGYAALYASISSTHHKALAVDLANTKFEIVRNMPYSTVGTVGGAPSGILSPTETVVRDNVSFTVTTTITNVDDAFDGTAGTGDIFPADYKLVEIKISCASCKNFNPITVTGRVAPKNLESVFMRRMKTYFI